MCHERNKINKKLKTHQLKRWTCRVSECMELLGSSINRYTHFIIIPTLSFIPLDYIHIYIYIYVFFSL
ncbi:hypothetical protein Hanom_Chr10g00943241 [Helianthus anomalus]